MTDSVILTASLLVVAGPAAGALYFGTRSTAFFLLNLVGVAALVLAVFAGVARHVAPIEADGGWLAFGTPALVALGTAYAANLVGLAVLILGMADVLPRPQTWRRRAILAATLGSPAVLLSLGCDTGGFPPLALLPILVFLLVALLRRPSIQGDAC